jgi:hypothetical protein
MLAELHIHEAGSTRAADLLAFLSKCDRINWEWYETEMEVGVVRDGDGGGLRCRSARA